MDAGRIQLDPPLTDVAWSDAFAGRSLETFFIFLRDRSLRVLRPIHAASLLLGWGPKSQPGAVVVGAAARYELEPVVVHSTSWRVVDDRLILTYLAVVEPPDDPARTCSSNRFSGTSWPAEKRSRRQPVSRWMR